MVISKLCTNSRVSLALAWAVRVALVFLILGLAVLPILSQSMGRLSGKISMKQGSRPLHGANVLIVELGRTTLSEQDGSYEFRNIRPGKYHVVAHLDHVFTESAKIVDVESGIEVSLDFVLSVTGEKHEITVTASERHATAFESFQDVESFDASDLTQSNAISLGEALDHQVGAGIAKRGFGPGSARPIIRGFDGDRVLIMEDGLRTGTLSSQAGGHHGEIINAAQLERLEIIKGPATLLYSGNAMGGTVNVVSRHHEHHRHPHQGLRGYILGSGGTTNALGGSSVGFEYGTGRWMVWGHGGGIRTGDYTAPKQGKIFNSHANMSNINGGFGWYGNRMFFSVDTKMDRGAYGIPFSEEFHNHGEEETYRHEEEDHHRDEIERITLAANRKSYRAHWGLYNLQSVIESFVLKLRYIDWKQDEFEFPKDGGSEVATSLGNNQFLYRGVFEQKKGDFLSGRFGFWGVGRDYTTGGEEALTPPVEQSGFAVFALEELDFERFKLQFGGRFEMQHYRPGFAERDEHEFEHHGEEHEDGIHDAIDRDFAGGSVAIGIHADLGKDAAFVANYASSYRPPALEELYNLGLHAGSAAFEIGNSYLRAERGNGIDGSLRYRRGRVRGEFNLFHYHFDNFIFPFITGDEVDGLRKVEFTQLTARFMGSEANLHLGMHRDLWLNLGMDYVNAQEMNMGTPLPRIPPLRAKIGIEYRKGGFHFEPELILASEQNRTFTGETRTPGYAVMNLKASYTYAQQHRAHQFSVNVFNVGDRLYRNHTSFIKDLAPEIGRGVRFTYMVRFF
jgi:iron complex outermembrane receptor protein